MHTANSILIKAPRHRVFEVAADLERWPEILPHYRFVKVQEVSGEKKIVKMAAKRDWIPVSWVSEFWTDPGKFELHFFHLKAFTKGMQVVWTMEETSEGVEVRIQHDLKFRIPLLAPVAEPIISGFFIHHIASQTLGCMKTRLEAGTAGEQRPS